MISVDLVAEPNRENEKKSLSQRTDGPYPGRKLEGESPKEIYAEHNISSQTISLWTRKYGEMDLNEARKLKALEQEKASMKHIIADQAMQIEIPKEVNFKKW